MQMMKTWTGTLLAALTLVALLPGANAQAEDMVKPTDTAKEMMKDGMAKSGDDMACCTASAAAGMVCGICNPDAKAEVGKPAINFQLKNAEGKEVMLSDFKGKNIVLTWADKDCPIYRGVSERGAFEALHNEFKDNKDVAFLFIDSGAKASQENLKAINAEKGMTEFKPTALLMDPTGGVGHMYAAKTTPHCFVINKEGKLVYDGAIDNQQRPGADAINYVAKALNELEAGKEVTTKSTKPYGCAVHYAPKQSADASAATPSNG